MPHPGFGVDVVTTRARKSNLLKLVLSITAGLLLFGAAPAAAATLQVSTSGTNSGNCVEDACATIQYAVSKATTGDTISVGAGTFTGSFVVDKPLTIVGTGATTVLKAESASLASLGAGSDGSELKNLAFDGGNEADTAIRNNGVVNGVKLTNLDITKFRTYSIAVPSGLITNWVLDHINAHGNRHGMRVRGEAQDLTIVDSSFSDNESHGFFVAEDGGTFHGLRVIDSEFNRNGDKGLYFERGTNLRLQGVEVHGTGGGTHVSPYAIEFNLKFGATTGPVSVIDSSVDGSPRGGIVVRGGTVSPTVVGATITGNVVSNALVGAGFENQVNLAKVTVSGNEFRNNRVGFANSVLAGTLVLPDDNVFSGNTDADIDGSGVTVILPKVTAPTIAGSGTVGETITCSAGVGSGFPAPTVSNEILLGGTPIAGATTSYTPTMADVGKAVSCRSTATNIGGNAAASSESITVAAPPKEPVVETPKFEVPKKPVSVPNNGKVAVLTIQCPEGTCKVNAPKKVKVKIGGKVYLASVKVQSKIGEGKSAKVRLVLPKAARRALKGKQSKASLKVTVVLSDGTKKTVKRTVKLKGKRR